jgi:hypothetical protein
MEASKMNIREQKILFAAAVAFMFCGYVASVATCPPWKEGEAPLVFIVEVAACLIPAFVLLTIARKLSEAK